MSRPTDGGDRGQRGGAGRGGPERQGTLLPGLKEARLDAGYSQAVLGSLSGVRPNTISELERGLRRAHPSTARRLADTLGVTVADLRQSPRGDPPPG